MSKYKISVIYLDNYWCQIEADPFIGGFLRKYFTVFKTGSYFAPQFGKSWDGQVRFLTGANRLPIGLIQELLNLSIKNDIAVEFKNNRTTIKPAIYPVKPDLLPGITLRDYQVEATNKCIEYGQGIVKIATGGGKTSVITAVLKAYNAPALIVAGQINLVMQLYDRMLKYGFPEDDVGIIYGDAQDFKDKKFIVSTIQSIMKYPEVYENAKLLIVDEVKHSQAASYVKLMKRCEAPVRLGFDATPFTYDDQVLDWTIKKCVGDVIYEKTTKDLIDMGLLVRPIIGMTHINNDPEIYQKMDYRTAYKELIVMNDKRNQLIKRIVNQENGRILVLIREIEHGRQLQHLIPDSTFLYGEIDSLERYNEIQNFVNCKDKYVLIGSTIFDEGIDFENGIDAIIIASAGKGFRKVVQRLGRALRKNKKGFVSVYDFYDDGNEHLSKHSKSRYNIYKNEKHKVMLI
jgi:superfamily II DNA or RNA helicase